MGKRTRKQHLKENRERLTRSIAGWITGTQHRIANRLNRIAEKATRKQQILFFIVVLLLFGSYCLYLILKNLY